MKRLFILVAVALFAATSLFAQSKLSNHSRIVILNANQDVKTQADFGIRNVNGVQMVSAFVTFNEAIDASLIAKYGGTVQSEFPANKVVTALLPLASLEPLSREQQIFYIEVGQMLEPKMDIARQASNVDSVITGAAPLTQSYLGRGVIVGVIDRGFQLDHPNFWNASHDRFRIKAYWDQNETGTGGSGYSYGKFYMDSASIIRHKYDNKAANGLGTHATHVLGIAAGADHTKSYYGTAQEADIVAVSTTGLPENIADAVIWIFDYADAQQKPCVINISMGSNIGPHDGTGTECVVFDSLSAPGHIVVNSAGNEGDIRLHLHKDFTANDTVRSMLKYNDEVSNAYVDIWGDSAMNFSSQCVLMDENTNTPLFSSGFIPTSDSTEVKYNYPQDGNILFKIKGVSSVSPINHKGNISWSVTVVNPSENILPGVMIAADTGSVDMWCKDNTRFFKNGAKGWTAGDNDMTINDMATAKRVIAVGAYNTRVTYWTAGDITEYSAKGPTADGRMKPEITAPGYQIISSVADKVTSDHNDSTVVGGETFYYGLKGGTSMACPYVTGVIAAWLEADPTLDYDRVMDIFRHSSIRDKYTGTNLPDNVWGLGKINAYRGLLYLLGLTVDVESVTEHQIVGIYPNPTADEFRVGFASADNNVTVTVVDLSGRAILSRTLGNVTPGQEEAFSLANTPAGIYMVRISGTNHTNTYKLVKE